MTRQEKCRAEPAPSRVDTGAALRELHRLMLRDQYEPVGTAFHHSSFARMLRGVRRGEA